MYAVFFSPRASYFVTEISVDGPELRTIRKVMGDGNFLSRLFFFRKHFPCMNWFGPVHEYFLRLVGVHEFLAFNFPLHGYVLYLARIPPPPLTFSDGLSRASYSPALHLYVLALYCVGVYPSSFNNRPYKFGLEEIRPRGIRAQKNPTGRAEAHKGRHNSGDGGHLVGQPLKRTRALHKLLGNFLATSRISSNFLHSEQIL